MVKTILVWVGVAILLVAAWKLFGGDPGAAITNVANFFMGIINAGADIVVKIWNSVIQAK